MARNSAQDSGNTQTFGSVNEQMSLQILQEVIQKGVTDFCFCPGKRNQPLFTALQREENIKKYFWHEERSAAFFALGRSRQTGKPVAVVTTSGTAVGELLPAAMEAHYTGIPLLLMTADRPRRYRGTGAPQTAEQVGIFGPYSHFSQDLADGELCDLSAWMQTGPAHLNICFDEPLGDDFQGMPNLELSIKKEMASRQFSWDYEIGQLDRFLHQSSFPLVVVGGLKAKYREAVATFLLELQAPVFLEGISGLREDKRLQHLRIVRTDGIWGAASAAEYSIDGILRIGGMPTFRLWRDLEDMPIMHVCSISDVPFSGLSGRSVIHGPIDLFLQRYVIPKIFPLSLSEEWRKVDKIFQSKLFELFHEEPKAETSLIHHLSHIIPQHALVYLGNSLPIREWDLAAAGVDRGFEVVASRGLNGIDGQLSTFLGLCSSSRDNWAILGDLTTLYDLSAPWIISQMERCGLTIVIINNYGGKIFERMIPDPQFSNPHHLCFRPFAEMWNLPYEEWQIIPSKINFENSSRVIEIVPNLEATKRFWKKL